MERVEVEQKRKVGTNGTEVERRREEEKSFKMFLRKHLPFLWS